MPTRISASIRRYSTRTWGPDHTSKYMATSGRHSIFFEADDSRILVVRVLHNRMDYRRHLDLLNTDEGA